MATVVKSLAVEGIEAFVVEIEATTIRGQQQMMSIIGLGDQAIKEAGERIQAAMEHCGYEIPKDKTVLSLAPGCKKKRGSHYDLGMLIALLQQTDQITAKNIESFAFVGELSLNGRLRACNGILSMITEAKKRGIEAIIIPYENRSEAQAIAGIQVIALKTLMDVVKYLERGKVPDYGATEQKPSETRQNGLDFADVKARGLF